MGCTSLTSALRFSYLQDACDSEDASLLFRFDERSTGADGSHVSTGLAHLGGPSLEGLFASATLPLYSRGDMHWLEHEQYLLTVFSLDEAGRPLDELAEQVYLQMLDVMAERGYPQLVRVWNYFERINEWQDGLERYQRFCVGRHKAFEAKGVSHLAFPSACALGHQGGRLLVYGLASKQSVQHFENPAQQEAYFYPERYGPKSPSFARASLCDRDLYVSGTASVVGHETLHKDDINGQIATTVQNLRSLIAHVAAQTQTAAAEWAPSILKVYLRHPEHLTPVREAIGEAFNGVPASFVHADICREDLLVEVDGIWGRVES